MKKQHIIIGVFILLLAFIVGGVWCWQGNDKNTGEEQQTFQQPQQQEETQVTEVQQQEFVVDVDPNIEHWQTKETEFFTIKFPKEWYWLESDPSKQGYPADSGRSYVITNNPDFDINKYFDIGIFTGGGYPLTLTNDTEVVISFNGAATSDAGTPRQSIDSGFRGMREDHGSETCEYLSNPNDITIVAYCSFTDENYQKVQTHFITDEKNTIFFSARTTENSLIQRNVLDKIAKSMILRGPF